MSIDPVVAASSPSRKPELGEVLDFMRLLWAVDHGLHSSSKAMRRRVGVTGPQRLVIRILGTKPGTSAGSLAKILHIHPSTLTGILRRLEARALIYRAADPKDGRRALLWLTPEGETLDAVRGQTVEAMIAEALSRLPSESIAEAVRVLLAIAETLGVKEPL